MPFMFVYTPMLMPKGFNAEVAYTWVFLFLSALPYGAGAVGYLLAPLTKIERVLLIAAGCGMAFPGMMSNLVGAGVFLAILGRQRIAARGTQLRGVT